LACFARPAWTLLFVLMATGAYADSAPSPVAPPAAPASPIEGVWLDSTQSQITVVPCDQGYCGNISKIVVPPKLYAAHKKEIDAIAPAGFTDLNNKDPKLRNRPILGLTILTLHPTDKPEVFDGTIYDPDSGNTFSGSLTLLGPDKMQLEGCLNVPGANLLKNLLCRDRDWTRVVASEPPPVPMGPAPNATSVISPSATATPAVPVLPAVPRPHKKPAASEPVTASNFQ
jgi:uncharacterized protein (DUF2147 family)